MIKIKLFFFATMCSCVALTASAQQAHKEIFVQELTTPYGEKIELPTAVKLAESAERCAAQADRSRRFLCYQELFLTARLSGMVVGATRLREIQAQASLGDVEMKAQVEHIVRNMTAFERDFR